MRQISATERGWKGSFNVALSKTDNEGVWWEIDKMIIKKLLYSGQNVVELTLKKKNITIYRRASNFVIIYVA